MECNLTFYRNDQEKEENEPEIFAPIKSGPQIQVIKIEKSPTENDFKIIEEFLPEENVNENSCCQIPDSLCSNPAGDCNSYIECDGNKPLLKKCPIGQIFDPYFKVCIEREKTSYRCKKVAKKNVNLFSEPVNRLEANDGVMKPDSQELKMKHNIPRININSSNHFLGVLREAWFNLPNTDLSLNALIHDVRYPNFPDEYLILDTFEAPPNVGDFYGQRLSSYYLKAPETGAYVFYLSCDDSCELWVGKNESEISLEKVAYLNNNQSTEFREWNKFPEFQATLYIQMEKQRFYLIEAFMRETRYFDHISVGVLLPGGKLELPIKTNLYLIPIRQRKIKEYEEKTKNIL